MESALTGHQVQPKGRLRISCPTSLGVSRLQVIFARFLCQHPLVELDVDLNDRKVDLVTDGFDALIRASGQLEDSSLISRRIMRSRAVTVAAPEYLEKHGTPQVPVDLMDHFCITYSNLKQPNAWAFKDKQGNEEVVTVKDRFTTNSSALEVAMVKAAHGITRIPYFIAEEALNANEIVEVLPDYSFTEIDVFIIYPSRKHMSSKVRAFIDFVVRELAEED